MFVYMLDDCSSEIFSSVFYLGASYSGPDSGQRQLCWHLTQHQCPHSTSLITTSKRNLVCGLKLHIGFRSAWGKRFLSGVSLMQKKAQMHCANAERGRLRFSLMLVSVGFKELGEPLKNLHEFKCFIMRDVLFFPLLDLYHMPAESYLWNVEQQSHQQGLQLCTFKVI